jgi:hypothetical protein
MPSTKQANYGVLAPNNALKSLTPFAGTGKAGPLAESLYMQGMQDAEYFAIRTRSNGDVEPFKWEPCTCSGG